MSVPCPTRITATALLSGLVALALAAPGTAQSHRPSGGGPPTHRTPSGTSAAAPAAALGAFGSVLVFDGEALFVGQAGETDLFPVPANRPGAVHEYRSDGADGWIEVARATAADALVGDGFGRAVAVADGRLVVGAPKRGAGAAYVFERDGDGWRQTARLAPQDGQDGDGFGAAVALAGDAVLVGAPGRTGGAGAVYVFRADGDAWVEADVLERAPDEAGSRFGSAILVSDETAFVSAPGTLPGLVPGTEADIRPGVVAAYTRAADGTWTAAGEASLPGAIAFGWAFATDGDGRVWASAPFAFQGQGAVFGLVRSGETWAAADTLRPDASTPVQGFGLSLGAGGGSLVVGAPLAASAFVFERAGGEGGWTQAAHLTNATQTAFFGMAAAARGETVVVGAPGADFFEGAATVYTRADDGSWSEAEALFDDAGGLQPITGGEVECADGHVGEFTCSEVDVVSFLPVSALGGTRGSFVNDLWGWTDPETGKEYALVGRGDATVFVDVSDAANPVFLGELPLTDGAQPSFWRDIKVYADHAFIVADAAGQHGVQIFDLRRLRDVQDPPVVFDEDAHYDGIASAHNIVINEETGFAYVVGGSSGGTTCGGGLHMIDVRDPRAPTFAGCFSDPSTGMAGTGYSHDAQCLVYNGPDSTYAGHEICLGSNENALSIADVTDKDNPVAVSTARYPNSAYAHQGWVSADHRFFFMNDEGDEVAGTVPRTRTLVWDIQDLDDPVLLAEHLGETAASDHNLYVRDQLMYQSNYVSGLRILDVSDPANPREVGYFDTVPWGEDAPGFAGSWSNYPYFESGIILVSSIREGLFVLKRKRPTVF
ncbi:MAG: choice-of-anchor B family protein [Gemmatimonadetes bacterium]|nr:MAG: choice-of-anchor B family protein [Gemmatimonadota bacterium]